MDSTEIIPLNNPAIDESIRNQLRESLKSEKRRRFSRFVLAALSSIPWVGGFLGAMASADGEDDQSQVNDLYRQWMAHHGQKINLLGTTLLDIMSRLDELGEETTKRVESPEYLALVAKGFRVWDQADTQEKRELIKRLLSNAGAGKLCPDDLIRLFIDWIERYHEAHFAVIREVYKNPGSTKADIWEGIHGTQVREDSAEADLFRLLISDLNLGRVIRKERETNEHGQFLKGTSRNRSKSRVMKSAFDDVDPQELTELGSQFVHYTMNDIVPRISGSETGGSSN